MAEPKKDPAIPPKTLHLLRLCSQSLAVSFGIPEVKAEEALHLNRLPASQGTAERLAFFGDAEFSAIIAKQLFNQLPALSEGDMSEAKAKYVANAVMGVFLKNVVFPAHLSTLTDLMGAMNDHSWGTIFEAAFAQLVLLKNESALKTFVTVYKGWVDENLKNVTIRAEPKQGPEFRVHRSRGSRLHVAQMAEVCPSGLSHFACKAPSEIKSAKSPHWHRLLSLYTAGTPIIREKIDIYSQTIDPLTVDGEWKPVSTDALDKALRSPAGASPTSSIPKKLQKPN